MCTDTVYSSSFGKLTDEAILQEYDNLLSYPYYQTIPEERLKREIDLEVLMRTQGFMRVKNTDEKAISRNKASNTSYGHALLKRYVYQISQEIDCILDVVREGKPGHSRSSLRLIKDMDSTVIAYLSLKTVIDTISQINSHVSLQHLGLEVGNILESEYRCQVFNGINSEQYDMAVKKIKDRQLKARNNKRDVYKSLFNMMDKAANGSYGNTPNPELFWEPWERSDKSIIGIKLLTLIAEKTQLIKITREADVLKRKGGKFRNKQLYYISINTEVTNWIKDWADKTGLMSPVCLPTVIPPKPYTTPYNGGYHTSLVRHYSLVKVTDKAYFRAIAKQEVIKNMSPVYNAVNTAMATAWHINTRVYEVLNTLWDKNTPVDCLPPQEELPVPVCPECGKPVDKDHLCFKDPEKGRVVYSRWMRALVAREKKNQSNQSKALIVHKVLWIASLLKDDPEIYFPYQLDFRGRIYALPQFLNPQGSDVAKGLLEFAEGKPIEDETASNWLAIHVANTYGKDKCSFAERIAWTHENTPMIQAVASDPLGTLSYWTNTDSPFCFLASCFEWSGFVSQGYGYVSHLPVALDGTCSGLQHYSAMLRDEPGGNATNLTPSDKPSDIYAVVAKRTEALIRAIPVTNTENYELAQQWLNSGLLNRKLTKRAVMTLPYGSTLYSAKDYVLDRIREARDKEHVVLPWTEQDEVVTTEEYNRLVEEEGVSNAVYKTSEVTKAGHWIANYIWQAIHETVVSAVEGMQWLKTMAGLVSDQNKPVSWVTPTGFVVLQGYVNTEARRIKTTFSGGAIYQKDGEKKVIETVAGDAVRVDLVIHEDTDTLDTAKQRSGVAPNFVHSLDASALVFAVNTARVRYGVESFALIHDSFGTHAADTESLAKAIRESFVTMYTEHDVLKEFEDQVKKTLPNDVEIPQRPAFGKLDINLVHNSLYFFS